MFTNTLIIIPSEIVSERQNSTVHENGAIKVKTRMSSSGAHKEGSGDYSLMAFPAAVSGCETGINGRRRLCVRNSSQRV